VEIPPEIIDRLLDHWPVARLATIGPSGPHIVPIVFARVAGVDDVLWSPIDGKPKKSGRPKRVSNVSSQPRAALLMDAWDSDWSRLWWLRTDVWATVVTDLGREAAAAVAALEAKYPQYQQTPLLREPPTLLRLRVDHRESWCAGTAAISSIESSVAAASSGDRRRP